MSPSRIPLFPLGLVLLPGAMLPLHIFEPRYRALVADLTTQVDEPDGPGPVGFGVVAIRVGRETGVDGVHALHAVGTFAELRGVQPYDDGRFDLVARGGQRFRVQALDTEDKPYLQADVEWLPESAGDDAEAQASFVARLFTRYRSTLGLTGHDNESQTVVDESGRDPRETSYTVASGAVLTVADQQALLEAADDTARLRLERELLLRELALWRAFPSLPDVGAARAPVALN
ncbi:MAG: LON peptidase substrate-binding domain-containing protein [Actinomycetes bacterium]